MSKQQKINNKPPFSPANKSDKNFYTISKTKDIYKHLLMEKPKKKSRHRKSVFFRLKLNLQNLLDNEPEPDISNVKFINNNSMDKEIQKLQAQNLNDDIFRYAVRRQKTIENNSDKLNINTLPLITKGYSKSVKNKRFLIIPKNNKNSFLAYNKNVQKYLNNKIKSNYLNLNIADYFDESLFEEEVKRYQLSKVYEAGNKKPQRRLSIIAEINSSDLENAMTNKKLENKNGKLFLIKNNNFNESEKNYIENKNNNNITPIKDKTKNKNLFNKSNYNSHANTNSNKIHYYKKLFDKKDLTDEKIFLKNYKIFDGNFHQMEVKLCQNLTKNGQFDDEEEDINQDSYIQLLNINGIKKYNLFGVLDGHGTNGHLVSKYLSRFIIEYFISGKMKKNLSKCKNINEIYHKLIENKYELIKELFKDCQNFLSDKSKINCDFSGTTCLLIIIIENNLICVNVGDSRAILLEKNDLIQLSIDQNFNDPDEIKRIIKHGGKFKEIKNEFKKNSKKLILDIKNNIDFNISRSLGDFKLKNIGIIFEPVITEYTLNKMSRFLIMGTKGLWNVLSNEKAAIQVNKTVKIKNPLDSCRVLVNKACDMWNKLKMRRDDITVITIFFEE